MWNTTFQYKAIFVGSLLLCKIQLVPLLFVPSFLKIDANQIVSMVTDLYRRKVRKKCNNMFKYFFTFYNVLLLNTFLFLMSHCGLRLQMLIWSPDKGRSESKTRRLKFLSSKVGNPASNRYTGTLHTPCSRNIWTRLYEFFYMHFHYILLMALQSCLQASFTSVLYQSVLHALCSSQFSCRPVLTCSLNPQSVVKGKGKAVPLHAMEALGGRGDIAPTHSRPRH
jgi:hypothetical protein